MIDDNSAPDLPKELMKTVASYSDSELNGQIDFEDFLKMSKGQPSLVREWCVKYCRQLVPRRSDSVLDDEQSRYSLETNYDTSGMNITKWRAIKFDCNFQMEHMRVK